jgi:phosphatidylinositol alpha-1,6-mannosyltransferase
MAAKRWAVRSADVLVSVSRFSQEQAHKNGIVARRHTVIGNGADSGRFTVWSEERVLQARRELGLPDGRLLLTVGNVKHRKGQDTVIRALPRVLSSFPDVHYLLAGLPTCRQEFESLAQRLGVGRNVHFLSRVAPEQTVALMNCCDLFLMTSRRVTSDFEGFGIAAIEAALCGKPSIVSDNCGLVEAVLDGVTGVVVAESDPDDTASAIASLLADPDRRKVLGENARRRAVECQTWESVSTAYHDLLTGLLSGKIARDAVWCGQSATVR